MIVKSTLKDIPDDNSLSLIHSSNTLLEIIRADSLLPISYSTPFDFTMLEQLQRSKRFYLNYSVVKDFSKSVRLSLTLSSQAKA